MKSELKFIKPTNFISIRSHLKNKWFEYFILTLKNIYSDILEYINQLYKVINELVFHNI